MPQNVWENIGPQNGDGWASFHISFQIWNFPTRIPFFGLYPSFRLTHFWCVLHLKGEISSGPCLSTNGYPWLFQPTNSQCCKSLCCYVRIFSGPGLVHWSCLFCMSSSCLNHVFHCQGAEDHSRRHSSWRTRSVLLCEEWSHSMYVGFEDFLLGKPLSSKAVILGHQKETGAYHHKKNTKIPKKDNVVNHNPVL